MKNILILLLIILVNIPLSAQDITGSWMGKLNIQGQQLRIGFTIKNSETGLISTMDSPDQGATGLATSSTSFVNSKLIITASNMGMTFEAIFKNNTLEGTFKQGSMSIPLLLSKTVIRRPQEPKEPYSYHAENITFENTQDNVTLAGTLTLPKKEGTFPVVVLISGSGPQNRDEELFGHKPFLVLADYLTRNGIAVLRYDDRGTAQSTGNFAHSVTQDLAKDAEAAVKYLLTRKEIDSKHIGLIGHSEGGTIAPMLASRNSSINYIIMLAGPALRGDKLMLLQKYTIEKQMGVDTQTLDNNNKIFAGAYDIVRDKNLSVNKLKTSLDKYFTAKYGMLIPDAQKKAIVAQLTNLWMINNLRLDPSVYLKKTTCPTLALYGSKDLQVPAKENIALIQELSKTAKHMKIQAKELEGLNHLFQECKTGSISEYGAIEQTMSPKALKEILDWIKKQVK